MPWVIRDVVDDINKAVTRRWRQLDVLLPEPSDLPEGCMAPLLARGDDGRPSGLGVCRHQHVAADWAAAKPQSEQMSRKCSSAEGDRAQPPETRHDSTRVRRNAERHLTVASEE
jgi:hypothetical protein